MENHSLSLSVEEARRVIGEIVRPLETTEKVFLKDAFFRVLAKDIISPVDMPSRDNAAMDGYAFCAEELNPDVTQILKVADTILAGHNIKGGVAPGECARIMTGGVIPAGCDTVIQQENVLAGDGMITLPAGSVSRGSNIRKQGEDIKAGDIPLRQGVLLKPAHLGLLAALGIAEVPVFRRPKVAIFSTGDELCAVGAPLLENSIYDSNRHAIYGMLKGLGCDVIDMGIIRDDREGIRAAFVEAAEAADVVIAAGGVSVGEADYTKQVMRELADMVFLNVNMRPGRPMAFGRMRGNGKETYVFGLPGNPVAVMVAFYFFVRDALFYLMGSAPPFLPRVPAKSLSALSRRKGRAEFQRGILSQDKDGNLLVRTTGDQGSGRLSSMILANCMIVLPPEQDAVSPGETVQVVPFEGLI